MKNNYKLNLLTICFLSIGLIGCDDEDQVRPSGEDVTPDTLVFAEGLHDVYVNDSLTRQLGDAETVAANTEAALPAALEAERERLESDPTVEDVEAALAVFEANFRADFRSAELYDGSAKIFVFTPENPTVAGMSPYATHSFTLQSDDKVGVNGESDCDSVTEENSVDDKIAHLRVASLADKRSVTMNDSLDFIFAIPENRFGVTYNATLNYGGTEHNFTISTPEAVLLPKMLDFYDANTVRTQPFYTSVKNDYVPGSSNLFNYDAITKESHFGSLTNTFTTLAVRDFMDEDENLVPVQDGQVYTFVTKKPITGLSNNARIALEFEYDETKKYTYTPYQVINRQVVYEDQPVTEDAIKIRAVSNKLETALYSGSCIKQDEFLAVSFHIPENTFDEEYTAKLTWHYYDDEGVAVEEPQVFDFKLTTEALDNVPDVISDQVFTNNSVNVNAGEQIYYQLNLTGYNADASISVTNAEYSIDGLNYSSATGVISESSALFIRVKASSESGATTTHSVNIAGQVYTWDVTVQSDMNTTVLNAGVDFPSRVSATTSDTVILRGHAYFIENGEMSTDGLSVNNIMINDVIADTFNPATAIWTKQVTTALGENDTAQDHAFTVTIKDIAEKIVLSNTLTNIRRLPNTTSLFPENVISANSLTDLSYDQRANTFYLASSSNEQLISFSLASDFDTLTVENRNDPSNDNKTIKGIQVNNQDDLSRRYLYKADGDLVATLIQSGYLQPKVSNNSVLNGPETVTKASQMAFDDQGNILYVTGDNEIAQVTPASNVFDSSDNYIQVPFRDSANYPDTHKKTISNQFSSQSVDILTIADEQYIVVLSRTDTNNTGNNGVWFIKKSANYNISSSATALTLVDEMMAPFVLNKATSISVDDKQQKAYVSNGGNTLVEIDLSTINTGNITATAKVLPFVSTEVGVGQLTSLVMEGGLPYIVATDSVNKSILAIDQYTGESVYLLQTTAPAVVE